MSQLFAMTRLSESFVGENPDALLNICSLYLLLNCL
jgi:hypothetical protein